jgi:hypothetical protein
MAEMSSRYKPLLETYPCLSIPKYAPNQNPEWKDEPTCRAHTGVARIQGARHTIGITVEWYRCLSWGPVGLLSLPCPAPTIF